MRHILKFAGGLIIGAVFFAPALGVESAMADDAKQVVTDREDYRRVPMPPGFRVESSELEGPVFANSRGMTLYFWPQDTMRNGITGDPKNQSMCTDVPTTVTGGLMSPYPPGLALPELDKRKSCAEVWPPELASDEDKPIGSFTTVALKDGRKQWAYDGHVLYTSVLDEMPGDVRGATNRRVSGEPPAPRKVATVPPAIPPGFGITSMAMGRMLVTDKNFSVYMSDRDGVRKSNCYGACARTWDPMLAPIQ